MAAAEYFNPGGGGQSYPSGQQPGPSPYNGGNLTPQNPPYPMSDAPPPYSAFSEQRPHSQPPPLNRPPGPAGHGNDIYRPAPPPANNGYPPEKGSRPPNQMNDYYQYQQQQQSSGGYQQYPPPLQQSGSYQQQPGGYSPFQGSGPAPQVRFDDRKPSTTPLYRPSNSSYRESERDRSRSRSRSRSRGDRHRKHHHHHSDRPQTKKKPSGASTFLGAGGGAILGDAIFPGLGTLGGALLGGLGGHEYGKKRASSDPRQKQHRSYSNDMDYGHDYRRDEYDRRGRKY